MIFANGKIYPSDVQNRLLDALPEQICNTRETQTLRCETVIQALDRMSRRIAAGEFTDRVADPELRRQIGFAAGRLTQEALRLKVRTELGDHWEAPHASEPVPGQPTFTVQNVPLGVILHIAAGNMDALPAWSVIEGLLTGNINILKLPQADKGLTIEFFRMLTEQTPELRDFVYIFDTPSTDIAGIRRLASLADGISVWGGDAAVSAVRQFAPVGCKLIEWGHRLSFCYISGEPPAEELTALASHILQTRQLLCSSCQVIYIDTSAQKDVLDFSEHFLPYLEAAASMHPVSDLGMAAQLTLRRRVQALESVLSGEVSERRIFQGEHTSVTACPDSQLELSELYGNVLVKPLPRQSLMRELRKSAGYLQTAGLICPAGERAKLTELLIRCGVNRVLPPGRMSDTFLGESHDGESPLRRYIRTVNLL